MDPITQFIDPTIMEYFNRKKVLVSSSSLDSLSNSSSDAYDSAKENLPECRLPKPPILQTPWPSNETHLGRRTSWVADPKEEENEDLGDILQPNRKIREFQSGEDLVSSLTAVCEENGTFDDFGDDDCEEDFFDEVRMDVKNYVKKLHRQFDLLRHVREIERNRIRQESEALCMAPECELDRASSGMSGPMEKGFQKLQQLHFRLKKNNERKITNFMLLFDLVAIIQFCPYRFFYEPVMQDKLLEVLKEWAGSFTFEAGNGARLANVLRAHYEADSCDIDDLYLAADDIDVYARNESGKWSIVYLQQLEETFKQLFERLMKPLPTFVQLGQKNLRDLLLSVSKFGRNSRQSSDSFQIIVNLFFCR